jgi:hypothetical protein
MWTILEDLGVDEAKFNSHRFPMARTAKWVLIRVDDPNDVCGIRTPRHSPWIEASPSRATEVPDLEMAG